MLSPIILKELAGRFFLAALLIGAAGPSAISARADNTASLNDASPALLVATDDGTKIILLSGSVSLLLPAPPNPKPLLYPPVPSSIAPGGPAFSLAVSGTGFVLGAVVNWNGSARATTFVSSNQLKVAITATDIANQGTAVVTVVNPAPGGGTSNTESFQITNALTPTDFTVFGNNEIDSYRPRPTNTVVADFNGDGKLDVAEYSSGIIYVLPGNGDGTFPSDGWIGSVGPPPPLSGAPDPNTYLATADVNGDGIPDLVIMNSNGSFIALGNGDGTFRLQSSSLTDVIALGSVVIADLNGDGFLDLAYVTPPNLPQDVPSAIQVQLGNGDGTFHSGPTTPFPFLNSMQGPNSLTQVLGVGDFNGDGRPDLLVTGSSGTCSPGAEGAVLLAFPGNGDGSFGTSSQVPGTSACGDSGASVVVADFNGDGIPDVAYFAVELGGSGPVLLNITLGDGTGSFGIPLAFTSRIPGFFPYTTYGPLLVADLNGDGKLDLVTPNQLFYGNGHGSFTPQSPIQNNGMQVIQVGDFNGDGRVDLLSLGSDPANSSLFDLRVLLQKPAPPDFTGGIPISSQTAIPGASASYAGTVASLNGFTGNVALSASGLPSGVTAGFSPATITGGSGSYTLTLTVGSAVPLGRYTITVMGTSGSLTHSTSVTLLVNSSVGDFVGSVAANSDSYQNVTAGQNATYIFQITPINGFSGNVTLGVANDGLSSGLPAGITGSFSPSIIVGGSGTSILTISTSPTESIGSFPLAVTATSGPIVHSGTVYLGVRSGAGDFSGFITPTSQTVAEGQTATYVANITYLNGFTPGMTDTGDGMGFMVSGLPAGAQFSTTINSVRTSTGETDSFAISAAPGTQPGTYTLLLTGSGGGRIHSTAFTLTVIPAS